MDMQFSVNINERKTKTKMEFFEAVEFEELEIKQEPFNDNQDLAENSSSDDSQVLERMSQILLPKLSEENRSLKTQVNSLTEENKVTVFESPFKKSHFIMIMSKGFHL